jgi:nickel-dependent lactate racemase
MNIELAYADGLVTLDIPSTVKVDTFAPVTVSTPLGFPRFRDGFLRSGGDRFLSETRPLIVVNDGYRTTPTAAILQWLDKLDDKLIERVQFLIATGIHDPPTEEHYRRIFGTLWPRIRDKVSYHDCHNLSAMSALGTDNLGGTVLLHKTVLEHRQVLIIGSVEPHYFAGFTGGRKALFPGLTDFATVARNHNLANSLDAAPLKLQGNPVAEHLEHLMTFVDTTRMFSVQVVTDAKQQTAGLFFGSLYEAFRNAAACAEEIYSHNVSEPYDVVVCEVLPPLDRNLYQAQKAVENCQASVKDGGALIVFSACPDGIGSRYFFDLAEKWDRQANRARDGKLHFGSHKLSRLVSIGRRITVYLHSSLPADDVRRVFYEPLDNWRDFLYTRGRECEICNMAVVHDAANTVLKTVKG